MKRPTSMAFDHQVLSRTRVLIPRIILSLFLALPTDFADAKPETQSDQVTASSGVSTDFKQMRFSLSNEEYGKLSLLRHELMKLPLVEGSSLVSLMGDSSVQNSSVIKNYDQNPQSIELLFNKYAPREKTPSSNLALKAITIENELRLAVHNTIGLKRGHESGGFLSLFKNSPYQDFQETMDRVWKYEMWKYEPTMLEKLEWSTSRLKSDLVEFQKVNINNAKTSEEKESIKSSVGVALSLLEALYKLTHRIITDNDQEYKEDKVALTAFSEMVLGALVYRTLLFYGKTIFESSKLLFSSTKYGGVPAGCILGLGGAVGFADSIMNFAKIFKAAGNSYFDPTTNFARELYKIKKNEEQEFNKVIKHSAAAGLVGGCGIAASSVAAPQLTAIVVPGGVKIAMYGMTLDLSASFLKAFNVFDKISALESHQSRLSDESKKELVSLKKELVSHLANVSSKLINLFVLGVLSRELKIELPHALQKKEVDRHLGTVSDDFANGTSDLQNMVGAAVSHSVQKIMRLFSPSPGQMPIPQLQSLSVNNQVPSAGSSSEVATKATKGGGLSVRQAAGIGSAIRSGDAGVLSLKPITRKSDAVSSRRNRSIERQGRAQRASTSPKDADPSTKRSIVYR